MAAGGMAAWSKAAGAEDRQGLYAGRRVENLAVVGVVAPALPEYLSGYLDYFTGSSHVSGTGKGHRDCSGGVRWVLWGQGNASGRGLWIVCSDVRAVRERS